MILQLKNRQNCKRPGEKNNRFFKEPHFSCMVKQDGFHPWKFQLGSPMTQRMVGSTPRSIHRDLLCCRSTTFQKALPAVPEVGKTKIVDRFFAGMFFLWVGWNHVRFDGWDFLFSVGIWKVMTTKRPVFFFNHLIFHHLTTRFASERRIDWACSMQWCALPRLMCLRAPTR